LYCPTCDIQLRGSFETGPAGPFARLNSDQLAFLRLFVTSRGNLSDIERTLGVSYPTVRAKLDDLIAAVQQPLPAEAAVGSPAPEASHEPAAPVADAAPAQERQLSRREILARVADGRMTAKEGFALINQLPTTQGNE
jgi:hypothetical protein